MSAKKKKGFPLFEKYNIDAIVVGIKQGCLCLRYEGQRCKFTLNTENPLCLRRDNC